MDPKTLLLLLGVIVVLYILTRLTAPLRQQESTQQDTNEKRWCYGCSAWMRDVERYWYYEGRTRVLSYLCPDCAFERHGTPTDDEGLPSEESL